MTYLSAGLLVAATACLAWYVTGRVRRYALDHLLDTPNARSSHAVPTPRGGGLGSVLAFCVALFVLWMVGRLPGNELMALLGGGLLVAAVGFWDDHGHLAARWRLLAHSLAAGWAVAWLGGIATLDTNGVTLELGWVGSALAVFWIVWMLNLFNFMDGIDGIAGGEAIFVAGTGALLVLGGSHAMIYVLFAAALAGFLVWNWPPAKIFMGDVGSGFVGFILGVFVLMSAMSGETSLVAWLILAGVFLVDATFTLLRRMLAGQRWWEAHRSHAYQHAAQRWGHKPVTLAVLSINLLWLAPWAWVATQRPSLELVSISLAYAPLIVLVWHLKAGRIA